MTPDLLIRLIADVAVIPVILIGTWALIFKVPKGRRLEAYSRILMAGLTAYMLAKFIGTIYQPESLRPFELMGVDPGALYLNNPGFPSDHALFVAALTCAVWFETRQKKTALVMAILVVLICVGRVLALVHTPFDVLGGVGIALVGALWYGNTTSIQEEHGHGTSHSKPTTSHR